MSRNRRDLMTGGWVHYLVLTFALSWLTWTPAMLATAGVIDPPLDLEVFTPLSIFVGAFGPLVAAVWLSRGAGGGEGARPLLRRGVQWKTVTGRAWLVILALPFAANGLARGLDTVTGGSPPPFTAGSVAGLIPAFVAILLLGGPVQEEFGWRGYALPRMLQHHGRVTATVLLGLSWTAWHAPFWFMDGAGMEGTPFGVYLLYVLGLTGVMTWLHLDTQGSIFAAILMHTTANWISNVLPTHGPEAASSNAYLYQAVFYGVCGFALLILRPRADDAGPVDARAEREPA